MYPSRSGQWEHVMPGRVVRVITAPLSFLGLPCSEDVGNPIGRD